MEVNFTGRKLTLADIRKASKKVFTTENVTEFKAGGLSEVAKDLKDDFALRAMARKFAVEESPNIAKRLKTDVVITGGTQKTLNDVNSIKGNLEVCGEWAPWSQVYKIMNK